MRTITLYTTPTCGYCNHVKQYFSEHSIEYTEINVAADRAQASEMIKKTGQMAVPVVSIIQEGIEKILVGYNKARLDEVFS